MKPLFALVVLFVACVQEAPQIQIVEKETFQELMTQEVQLIDIRTPAEFEAGFIGSAININYNAADFAEQISKLDRDKPVLVYCAVGGRSALAAKVFESLGFKTIYDLKGGYNAW